MTSSLPLREINLSLGNLLTVSLIIILLKPKSRFSKLVNSNRSSLEIRRLKDKSSVLRFISELIDLTPL